MASPNTASQEIERKLTADLLRVCAAAALQAGAGTGVGVMRPALRRLLILHPANPKVLGIFITALVDLDEARDALKWGARSHRVLPDSLEVAAAAAKSTYQLGDPGQSRDIWRDLVGARPLQEWYRLGLAQSLVDTGPAAAAIGQLRLHLLLKPDTAVAHVLLARALQHEGARRAGRRVLARAVACEPFDQVNRVNMAWHRLREAPDKPASWKAFGARWGKSPYRRPVNGIVLPSWRGPRDSARRLILRQEIGLGDQVLYSHFLPTLDALGLSGAMVAAPRLHRLFTRSFPGWKLVGDASELSVDDFDAQIFAGDLGQHVHAPRESGYLVTDRRKVAVIGDRYIDLGFKHLVGFAWRGGNTATVEERRRAIPLPALSRLFEDPELGFVCLQHGVTQPERDFLAAYPNVIFDDAIDPLGDLDDLATQIAAMDLVVTGASANTHFAAALGVRVIALLPYIAHWHWGLPGITSPWYPTAETIRQSQPGQWSSVLEEAAQTLREIS